ncbi:MAG TPA: YihY/virulence factor BrkB family protein [Rhizomicrobium sp.]
MTAHVPIETTPVRGLSRIGKIRRLAFETVEAFVADDALSRGAAIAFYSVTALAPVLIVAIWIAGSVFGRTAARDAISWQFHTLMGGGSSKLLTAILERASMHTDGFWMTLAGIAALLFAASGVFTEMQSALNAIWKAPASDMRIGTILANLLHARVLSLALVAGFGFFLLVSLSVTAGLVAFGNYLSANLPLGTPLLWALNFATSFLLLAFLFAAIYKVLPDVALSWRDVAAGGILTAILFDFGKFLIGFYIGRTAIADSFGPAGALVVVLLWVYYSAQLFLFGAEFTKIYSKYHGSSRGAKAAREALEHG